MASHMWVGISVFQKLADSTAYGILSTFRYLSNKNSMVPIFFCSVRRGSRAKRSFEVDMLYPNTRINSTAMHGFIIRVSLPNKKHTISKTSNANFVPFILSYPHVASRLKFTQHVSSFPNKQSRIQFSRRR
jgi:hypothetical protein